MERTLRGSTLTSLRGRRIQIAGSASPTVDPELITYSQKLVKQVVSGITSDGGGFVVTVGDEPLSTDKQTPLIYDWTVLETFDKIRTAGKSSWNFTSGPPIVAIGFPNFQEKIPENRRSLWQDLVENRMIELVKIRTGLNVGGILREYQVRFGDVLIALGGRPGVEHLAALYMLEHKPVIPLDLRLQPRNNGPIGAEKLSIEALEYPKKFFELDHPELGASLLSGLTLASKIVNLDDYEKKLIDFLHSLAAPVVFYVRLQDKKSEDFDDVERYFRNVVDPVVQSFPYRRFESSVDTTNELFLNVEIFQQLHYASLSVVDLTALRPNCFTELGYALGRGKKIILTAREGTIIPFDTKAIPCHFWSPIGSDADRRKLLLNFIALNINRGPLIKQVN